MEEKKQRFFQNLESLFAYMLSRLPDVDFQNDPGPALEVMELLEPLRESWRELAKRDGGTGRAAAGSAAYGSSQPGASDETPQKPSATSFSA